MRRAAATLAAMAVLAAGRTAGAQAIVTVSTGLILLKDDSVPPVDLAQRYVKFKSRTKLDDPANQVVPPAPGSAGDPTSAGAGGGGATFTVYNTAGTGESFTIELPATRWVGKGTPYTFTDPDGPIFKVYVRPYKLYVRGGKGDWGYTLSEPAQRRIAVRLTLGTGISWCAEAPAKAPPYTYDHQDKFWSAKAPAPTSCPPLPGP